MYSSFELIEHIIDIKLDTFTVRGRMYLYQVKITLPSTVLYRRGLSPLVWQHKQIYITSHGQ